MRLVVASPVTYLTRGPLTWQVGLGLLSLLVLGGLILRNMKTAFVITIVGTCFISLFIKLIIDKDQDTTNKFGELSMSAVAGQLNFEFDARVLYVIPLVLIHHLFDAVACSLVLLRQAYFSGTTVSLKSEDIEESLISSDKVRAILIIDGIFVILSGVLGSSPTTPFIESATGISVGARTGLARFVLFFFLL